MNHEIVAQLISRLRVSVKNYELPLVNTIINECGHNPFLILVSCLLSLRAKDSVTVHVCRELFKKVTTPQQLLQIARPELEQLVFKTGYYKNKAQVLHEVSRTLIERFEGKVPATYEELIGIKGVGPKTANLVLGLAYGVPAVCVDTHVHRISNRLGLIKTKTVEETEAALKKLLAKEYWVEWNYLLVMWGQNICHPTSPKCSKCAIRANCARVGVTRSR